MSLEKKTYGIIANLKDEVIIRLYSNYAKKLLRYSCNKFSIGEDEAWAII
jgi:hypothetical protein